MLALFFMLVVVVGLSLGSGLVTLTTPEHPSDPADLGLSWLDLNEELTPRPRVFTDCYTQPEFWDFVESQLQHKIFITIKPMRNGCAQLVARRGGGKYIGASFAKHDRAFLIAALLWESLGELVVIDKREPVVSQTMVTVQHNA